MLSWLQSLFASPPQRTPAQQQALEQSCTRLALYSMSGCLFCYRVLRVVRRLELPLEQRNISFDPSHRSELIEAGGRRQAPCLRIEDEHGQVRWLYESADIIRYLNHHFG